MLIIRIFFLLSLINCHYLFASEATFTDNQSIVLIKDNPKEIWLPFSIWSQLFPVVEVMEKGIQYTAYLRCSIDTCYSRNVTEVAISFLETRDPKFVSLEGIRIGDSLKEINANFSYGEECKQLRYGLHACSGIDISAGSTRYNGKVSRFIKEIR